MSGALPSPRCLRLADRPAQSWRNGGGVTHELLAAPAGPWRWRLSVATIAADGPFSAFPGVERWFTVIEGHGVELALGGAPRALRLGDPPLRFDGAAAPGCRLLDGPTRDLNLMLRGVAGRLAVVRVDEDWAPEAAQAGLLARVACTVSAGAQRWAVPANSLLWFDAAPPRLQVHGDVDGGSAWWIAVDDDARAAAP
jgi:hypothetical protein